MMKVISNTAIEKDEKTRSAVTLTIVNTLCIAWLAHVIHVVAASFGMISSVDFNPALALALYVKYPGCTLTLPEFLLVISIFTVIAVFLGCFIYLPESRARWRQLFLLSIASLGLLSYSYRLNSLEDSVYKATKTNIIYYEGLEDKSDYEQQELSTHKDSLKQYEKSRLSSIPILSY